MGMITDAIVLSVATTGAGYMLWRKTGPKVKKFIIEHPMLSEVSATVLTYFVHGGGVTAIMSAGFVCLMFSGMIYIASNPEDFVWLDDSLKRCGESLEEFKRLLKEKNEEYKASKV